MDRETVLLISGASDAAARFNIESVGISLTEVVGRKGGVAWAGWTDSVLKIRIQGVSPNNLRAYLEAYTEAFQKTRGTISIVEQQVAPSPMPDVASGEIPWGTVLRKNLTKKLINALPEGAYVVSNLFHGNEEIFAERIGPTESRDVIWKRAVLAGASNRTCRIVWSQVDFDAGTNIVQNRDER